MKIGVATFHKSHNYGALLQAIALRFVIQERGHQCLFVDYWPTYHKKMYNVLSRSKLKTFGVRYLLSIFKRTKRYLNFEKFIAKYVLPNCSSETDQYDVVVYGSDQIWRRQPNLDDYDPFYFGQNNLTVTKHVSYAASMGVLSNDTRDKNTIMELVGHLDAIAVRESDLLEYIQSVTEKKVYLSLDPTLLLSKNEWMKLVPQSKKKDLKYILYYDLLEGSFDDTEILNFAEKLDLPVIRISGVAEKKRLFINEDCADPEEFLNLVNNAEYVFTSSFHGLVFSVIFNKRFYASFSKNGTRAESILNRLGLSDYLLPAKSSLPQSYVDIDYDIVNKNLLVLRDESLAILTKIISE